MTHSYAYKHNLSPVGTKAETELCDRHKTAAKQRPKEGKVWFLGFSWTLLHNQIIFMLRAGGLWEYFLWILKYGVCESVCASCVISLDPLKRDCN